MITCSRCGRNVDRLALSCPRCGNELKAHGHPGIILHRAEKGRFLCDSCVYHLDDSCNFPARPVAESCTLYRDVNRVEERIPPIPTDRAIKNWTGRNRGLLLLIGIVLLSIALIYLRR